MKRSNRITHSRMAGLALVTVLTCIVLAVFYGKIVGSMNTVFFSTEGDGIQCYFNSYYLAKYDTSLMYSRSMNYPYGEVSFYTLSQPLAFGLVKFISSHVTDITGYTVGIVNFMMLVSILLAAVFLYLLMTGLNFPVFLSAIISIGITFLSPQLDRFGGHYTLAYLCALPMLMYLLLLLQKSHGKIIYSILSGILLFILLTGHVYFMVFYAILILFYWFSEVTSGRHNLWKTSLHIALQLIIPVALFYLITYYYADLTPDKPSKPYGLLVYKASPESVFLPLFTDYGHFLHQLRNFGYVKWEGISYVGLVAAIGFFVILTGVIRKLFRKQWKAALQVTDNPFLNGMFWASFFALLYSFGIPFILGLQSWVDLLGPLQQIRSIGRFAWIFFYVINIVVFYKLWLWYRNQNNMKSLVRMMVLIGCIIMLLADAFLYVKNRQNSLYNRFPAWVDIKNETPENQWAKQLNPEEYQALIPLPFYHMGSDNYGMNTYCNILGNSFLVSMKTGLPVMAVYMSRASVTQSIKNIALALEPYRQPEILDDLPNKKPFLVVAEKCPHYTDAEKNLLRFCSKVDSSAGFYLYHLEYDSLLTLADKRRREVIQEFADKGIVKKDSLYKSMPAADVLLETFDVKGNGDGYQGKGMITTGRNHHVLYEGPVPKADSLNYTVSFWFSPINADLYPKTRIELILTDSTGNQCAYLNEMTGKMIRTVDGTWGLIECDLKSTIPADQIKVTVNNTQIKRNDFYTVDEILIRPEGCDVYYSGNNYVYSNNLFYFRDDNKD